MDLFIAFIPFIILHELLHGFTWQFFCKYGWRNIYIGMMWKQLTPYCHCKEPLGFKSYMLGALMPFIVLGLGVTGIGILLGSGFILFLGLMSIIGAGGDLTIVCYLFRYRKAVFLDHPSEVGFIAFQK